jgi:hypothetical protein
MALHRNDEAAPLLRETYPLLVKSQGEQAMVTRRAREALAVLDAGRATSN